MVTHLDAFGNVTQTIFKNLQPLVENGDALLSLERVKSPIKPPKHEAVMQVGGFIRQADKSIRIYPTSLDIWSSSTLIEHLDYVGNLGDRIINANQSLILSDNLQSLELISSMRFSQKVGETRFNSTLDIDALLRAFNA